MCVSASWWEATGAPAAREALELELEPDLPAVAAWGDLRFSNLAVFAARGDLAP
jgi:hypothetical protein